ncbi:MAG: LacI family transcriptional regulator [Actinomyces sp.]|nr:LacI family DNA-binding transcriptional regulator [Actinomyces sp.]MCI1787367.1 LacI family transcriptional regulator [Actinomyces sp.]MCI1830815.1 LacI family transcriptional regulator [Actinomyces sp.]
MSRQGRVRRRPPTLQDVARLAGVSTAVVSYVINDGPRGVAPATRERVLDAIETLGYRPNSSARALRRGATHLIGVLLPDIVNPFHAEFVAALDNAAAARQYSILLATTHHDPEREYSMLANLLDRGIDGLLILTYLYDRRSYTAAADRVPRVMIDESSMGRLSPLVGPDLRQGAELAASHLIGHGHTRIGFVTGALPGGSVDFRRIGWESVLGGHGLAASLVETTEWSRAGGYEGARRLLDRAAPPTAIFAGSDLLAVGVLQALHERGLDCPGDIAVISFDGTTESQFSWPPLTTVRHPFEAISTAAVDTLISGDTDVEPRVLPMELIVRQSCGCPPSGDGSAREGT